MMQRSRSKIGSALAFCLILSAALLLSSCGDGSTTGKTKLVNYYTGSNGITIDVLNKDSFDEIYENTSFGISLLLENEGACDVTAEKQGYLMVSYDPFYVSASIPEGQQRFSQSKNGSSILVSGIRLMGKSRYYPSGEDAFVSLPNFMIKPVLGQRSKPDTNMFITFCYPYNTFLATPICVDMNVFRENVRRQVCTQADVSFSDQGAPVAVSSIEVDNQPINDEYVRPVFIIHITNVGMGSVLSPANDPADLERVCTASDPRREDYNTVAVDAFLSEKLKLDCKPATVRLYNEEGVTRCSVRDEDLQKIVVQHQNYEAQLTVNLSYVYQESASENIEIKRFELYGGSNVSDDQCESYVKMINGVCITKCKFCSEHPEDYTCQPSGAGHQILFDKSFSCQCSSTRCNSLYPDGLCVPSGNYCAGISYCCSPPCTGAKIKGEDGSCYSRCSKCSKITSACLCDGSESSISKESPVGGGYCCPSSSGGSVFDTEPKCDEACGGAAQ
jgi:hypothetical protein